MLKYGSAYITSTACVRDRLSTEMELRGRPTSPIHVAALPSPLEKTPAPCGSEPRRPYFVLLGTIEPRKNHLLILNIWRDFAMRSSEVPTLVLIGGRGWEHEQVADMIDRCDIIRPHVFEAARLSASGLSHILTHAQALLMPSVDEGYGLPVVEALSLGTPVIASDIPVFREVAQHCAILVDPIDGVGWRDAIGALVVRQSEASGRARAAAARFRAPAWPAYFEGVERFLATL